MKKLLQYIKPYTLMLLCAVALLFVQARCDLALPDYTSEIVNKGVLLKNIPFIWKTGLNMLLVALIGVTASVSVGFLSAQIAAKVARKLRLDVFRKVHSFSNAEFDKLSTASLITRTTNDITQIQTLLTMVIRMVFYAPIMGVGGIIKALSNSASMTWIIGVAVIVLMGVVMILFNVAMPKFHLIQKLIDRLNLVSRENLDGMLVIRAFNTHEFEKERFDKANRDLTNTNLFVNKAMATMMPAMMLIMNLTQVIIVWVGASHIAASNLDIGSMMAYMQYAVQIIMSFLMLSMMFILIPRAAVAAERVAEVLDTEESIKDPSEPVTFDDDFAPDIEFRNVEFRYPDGENAVLHDISFTAQKGQTTAFIGSTGSGKSTIVNLVMRFYDVTSGEILVGGKDIKQVRKSDLRDKIGYVPQKGLLFSGTINSNLHYGDRSSTAQDIEKAVRVAQATEFIEEKLEGYDTPISQGGTNVSGGQRQRLSIARALVKNAPIYIFDDSFSALDFKTDRKLRAALKKETGNSTILLVAQRVNTIMDAEQIIVLENGKIAGIGTHKELLKNCDVYYEIASSQLSEEELEGGATA